jgi:hypothetical protein
MGVRKGEARKDTQITELTGRHWLIGQLLQAELEIATPVRDKHIDLIVYSVRRFIARPIQVKAATAESFQLTKNTKKFQNFSLYMYGTSRILKEPEHMP